MTVRLLYLVSHPIQYQAPLLRRIAAEPGMELSVVFERDTSGGYHDEGFGRTVRWDVPLCDGYAGVSAADIDVKAAVARSDAVWIHGWQSPLFRNLLDTAAQLGVPVLMRGENTDAAMPDGFGPRGWLKRRYLARIFRRCSAFLAIGSDNRDYYLRRGVSERRVFPMPYAIDNQRFSAAAEAARDGRDRLRADLGLPPGRKVVLYAGKLTPRKHPRGLLDAWSAADWSGMERPLLLFVGDGELRPSLQAAADADVHFTGFRNQSEMPALYDLADVFVLASEREPWGLAVNEAMACGTAVIVSDQCGCARDLVSDECGAVVPVGSRGDLAVALRRVLDNSDAMGRAAAARIAHWDFEADVAGLKRALASVGRAVS